MNLGEAQREFTICVAKLIIYSYEQGFELTLGDAYRDPRAFGATGVKKGYGRSESNHKRRLAIDLNLFREEKYLADTESHKSLGEWWEALGAEVGLPLVWGGRFSDGNHYSMDWHGHR